MPLALFIVAVLVAAIPALAHSWYPLVCCGKMDCFPVACDQLVETVSGWLYVPTGNLFKRDQVQPSQDHHCHVCLGHGRDHRSICAFIVSLVSCPIALYPASSEREKISFHQLNKNTGHRIKYRKVDAESGDEVESADIIKGYEV